MLVFSFPPPVRVIRVVRIIRIIRVIVIRVIGVVWVHRVIKLIKVIGVMRFVLVNIVVRLDIVMRSIRVVSNIRVYY